MTNAQRRNLSFKVPIVGEGLRKSADGELQKDSEALSNRLLSKLESRKTIEAQNVKQLNVSENSANHTAPPAPKPEVLRPNPKHSQGPPIGVMAGEPSATTVLNNQAPNLRGEVSTIHVAS